MKVTNWSLRIDVINFKANTVMKKLTLNKVIAIILLLIAIIVIFPFVYGPDGTEIIQKARDAGILIDQTRLEAMYLTAASATDNAAPELELLFEEFVEWCDFFDNCSLDGSYQFQYTPGTEQLAEEARSYRRYPEPAFNISGISAQELANLDYYISAQKDRFEKINPIIDRCGNFYYEDWTDWTEGLSGLGLLKAVARLENKQSSYYSNNNQPEEAIKCIERLYKIADFASGTNEQMGQLVSSGVYGLAQYSAIEQIALHPDSKTLSALEKIMPQFNVKDKSIKSLTITETAMYEIDLFGLDSLMEWTHNIKYVKYSNANNYLEFLIDFKTEFEARDIDHYSTIYEDLRNKHLPGEQGLITRLLNRKVYNRYPSDARMIEIFLRVENISRIIQIAIAQEKYLRSNNSFASDLSTLKADFPDLDLIDLLAQKQGSSFGYELITDPDGRQGFIVSSDFLDELDPKTDTDPLEDARGSLGSFWSGGPYRFVLKIIR